MRNGIRGEKGAEDSDRSRVERDEEREGEERQIERGRNREIKIKMTDR